MCLLKLNEAERSSRKEWNFIASRILDVTSFWVARKNNPGEKRPRQIRSLITKVSKVAFSVKGMPGKFSQGIFLPTGLFFGDLFPDFPRKKRSLEKNPRKSLLRWRNDRKIYRWKLNMFIIFINPMTPHTPKYTKRSLHDPTYTALWAVICQTAEEWGNSVYIQNVRKKFRGGICLANWHRWLWETRGDLFSGGPFFQGLFIHGFFFQETFFRDSMNICTLFQLISSRFVMGVFQSFYFIFYFLFSILFSFVYLLVSVHTYIWGIPAQIDLTVTLTILDFLSRNVLKGVPKNTVHEVIDFLKKFLASISTQITQKTENDTVGRYRFG